MLRPILAGLAMAAGLTTSLRAQGWIDVEPRPDRPIQGGPGILRISSQVRTTVDGRIARVEVEEQFRNAGGAIAEGTYLYPMPGEAVFSDFSLWMGEREQRGEMMNAEQARGIYEDIVRKLKDPALLTLEGHGLIRARVFPIQPGETRKVVLRYTQVLERSGDALRLRYAIGQRGGRPRGWGDDAPVPTDRFSYRVSAPDAGIFGMPYSPTHTLQTDRRDGRLEITLEPGATGDVEIFLPLRRGLVGTSVVTHAPGGEDGFFLLLLSPPQADEASTIPRDLTLVVDVSGSMSGEKLDQAKAAVRQSLSSLRSTDRFRLIAFSSTVREFREGFTPATPDAVRGARMFVDGLGANGGTNIAGALDAALGATVGQDRLPIVIFLTDGVPSVGEQSPERIADQAEQRLGRTRIFPIGVGSDVNTYLLDRLSVAGRGSVEYVAPDASIETAVGALLGKIQHPALTNLRITDSPVRLAQMTPSALPDLFYGQELVVFGRYQGSGEGEIVIEGERAGRRERFTTRAAFVRNDQDNDFIPRLWASRRVGELTRAIRLEGAAPALVNEVRDLALRYGILTEYTSYLVQEPVVAQGLRGGTNPNAPTYIDAVPVAPEAQTGAMAFRRAESSSNLAKASTLAEADQAAGGFAMRDAGARVESRRVGGRLFVKRDAVWTDAAHADSLRVTDIAPFSEAYFALVRALPEIAPFLAVGDQVLVSGKRASIRITPGGATALTATDIQKLTRAYRGT